MNLLRLLTLIVMSYCLECFRVKSLNKIRRDTFKLVIEDNQHRADEYNLVRRASSVTTLVIDEHEDVDDENVKTSNIFYEDPDRDASVVIEQIHDNDGVDGVYSVSGVLGPDLIITPASSDSQETCDENSLCLVRHNVTKTKRPGSDESGNDYQPLEREGRISVSRSRQGKSFWSRKVVPEILVVVDYTLFKKLGYNAVTARDYVVNFFNAVNMRFRSLSQPSVDLHIAGVLLGKTKSSFPFLSSSISQGDMLDAPGALHLMGKYYYKTRSELPVFDMVVTLTGLDMARMKSGEMSRTNTGYAYVGGACVRNAYLKKISSVALVEDSGGYSGVIVAAHEIGHLLGAVHDGDAAPSYLRGPGAKSCSWSDGFIMSDLRRSSRGLSWSQCSVKQMKYFLSTSTAACLYNSPQSSDFSLPGDDDLPGFSTSLDDQCRQDRGTRACYKDQRVCSQLFCYTSNYSGCYAFRPAAEGSECGRNKICINGKCVKRTSSYKTTKQSVKKSEKLKRKSKTSKVTGKAQRKSSRPGKQSISRAESNTSSSAALNRKSKSRQSSSCTDSFALIGSLRCQELFKRYAHHYCDRSKVVRKRCCKSYNKYCGNNNN